MKRYTVSKNTNVDKLEIWLVQHSVRNPYGPKLWVAKFGTQLLAARVARLLNADEAAGQKAKPPSRPVKGARGSRGRKA